MTPVVQQSPTIAKTIENVHNSCNDLQWSKPTAQGLQGNNVCPLSAKDKEPITKRALAAPFCLALL